MRRERSPLFLCRRIVDRSSLFPGFGEQALGKIQPLVSFRQFLLEILDATLQCLEARDGISRERLGTHGTQPGDLEHREGWDPHENQEGEEKHDRVHVAFRGATAAKTATGGVNPRNRSCRATVIAGIQPASARIERPGVARPNATSVTINPRITRAAANVSHSVATRGASPENPCCARRTTRRYSVACCPAASKKPAADTPARRCAVLDRVMKDALSIAITRQSPRAATGGPSGERP